MMKKLIYGLSLSLVILVGCQSIEPVRYVDPADPLTGYFQIVEQGRNKLNLATVIPVLKIDGTYYSTCRGMEVPLRRGPGGLEWDLEPSSMTGTTIGRGPDGNCFIVIRDSQSEMFTSETSHPHNTDPRPMVRIDKPSWLPDVNAPPPHKNDDLVGFYQPLWFPYYRIEIYKQGGAYFCTYWEVGEDGQFKKQDYILELAPFMSGIGLIYSDRKQKNITCYNADLKRYEIIMAHMTPQLRMPLVRVKPTDPPPTMVPIGIPSWH